MKSSRVIIFIAVILIFIVIFLKFSQDRVATLPAPKKSNPAPLSQAPSQAAAPPQSQPTTPPIYAETEEVDTTSEPAVYVSEYKGKSQ
ncbi:MAG: hypothetical protein AABZ31_13115, partial [Bdellovibrionota bacterium]